MATDELSRDPGFELLWRLVSTPSLSGQEGPAVQVMVDWMARQGMQAAVDDAGNAVGLLDGGPAADGTPPHDMVLLGHIDTVPGALAVTLQDGALYGRGAVDAKGPLAAFAAAAVAAGPQPGWRTIVVGAVEEESATSKGARHVARQYSPTLAVIGEPSGWQRVTLGYKGRLLVTASVRQPMSHRSGASSSACEQAIGYWNRVSARAAEINTGKSRPWDQVLPTLRSFHSEDDGLYETARLELGFRLPLDLGPEALRAELDGLADGIDLAYSGPEVAYRAEKDSALVRVFLGAIRNQGGQPGFVLKTGTSDMNVVGPAWGCPILAYGPGDSSLDHTPEENVTLDEWQRGVAVLSHALRQLPTLVMR